MKARIAGAVLTAVVCVSASTAGAFSLDARALRGFIDTGDNEAALLVEKGAVYFSLDYRYDLGSYCQTDCFSTAYGQIYGTGFVTKQNISVQDYGYFQEYIIKFSYLIQNASGFLISDYGVFGDPTQRHHSEQNIPSFSYVGNAYFEINVNPYESTSQGYFTGPYFSFSQFGLGTGQYSANATLSAVPLPSSAPLFGVAFITLAGVSFGVRRRRQLQLA